MTQILLVEADENLRTIIKLNLMKTLGVAIIEKESATDAIALLDILPNIDIVFSRDEILEEKTSKKIAGYLLAIGSTMPLVILGKKNTDYPNASAISAQSSWKLIIETAAKILGMIPDWEENRLRGDYISVPVAYFLNIHNTNLGCDAYIRVKKSEGEYQYIKRFHSQYLFSREDIEKYIESGLKEFYISKDHFSTFVTHVTNHLINKLRQSSGGKERLVLTAESFEVTIDRIHSIGIDQDTIDVVQESIKAIEASLKEGSALSDFLLLLNAKQFTYLYAHSYFSCLLLHKIVEHFDWNTKKIKDKLTYLAYFHDISLIEDDHIKINDLNGFNKYVFDNLDQKKRVHNHAMLSSQIIDRFPGVPIGVSTFIKEHHGVKNGIGFPDTLSTTIAPLSMMFIVVETFVDSFLQIKGTPTLEEFEKILRAMRIKYNKSTYLQTLNALEALILGNKIDITDGQTKLQ